jgi:hypothetical protein
VAHFARSDLSPLRLGKGRDRLRKESAFQPTGKTNMPAPLINGIVESCLYSNDLVRSIRFYQGQLGLP